MTLPRPLSQFTLKIIAIVSMLLDHIGFFLFPKVSVFRILGRLAFPIFAFFIAEGVRYTKSRKMYLLRMIIFGIFCQIPALLYSPSMPLNIFITFSLSIIIIYLFDWLKGATSGRERLISMLVNVVVLILAFALTRLVYIEYGFAGILFAPLASLPRTEKGTPLDIPYRVCMTIPAFIVLAIEYAVIYQVASLLAIPLLLLYSGRRGKYHLKYFFYIFYPSHLLILYLISILIK